MLPHIRSHSPLTAISWIKQGLNLYKKQFIRFSLLFIAASMLLSIATLLPLIGIFLALISVPLSQMLLFNAAYGTRLRGHFIASDLRQKLHTGKIWARLLIATIINVAIVYILLSTLMPSLPVSTQAYLNLSDQQAQTLLLETYTISNVLAPLFCIGVYLILSFWVYPLICWEDLPVVRAFIHSFKASMSNAIALSLVIIFFIGLSAATVFITETLFEAVLPSISVSVSLFLLNTIVVAIYLTLFVAYMEIFYGKE
ncbi:MAG: hypothetical protein SOX43_02430 [Pelistega sp.]|nr:hypothetical protein [Pelistega sp.]